MNCYLPEGRSPHPAPYTAEELKKAMYSGETLEAAAIKCDEHHDLYVDLGAVTGIIPREEAALGVREGSTREISILSRVGKPVCFQVTDLPPGRPPRLSRRRSQEEALAHCLQTFTPGDIIPATVTSLTSFGAFCDVACGVPALLPIENISVSRISHARERFRIGQKIHAVVKFLDAAQQRIFLTHRELLGTWEENAAQFRAGQTVTGIVRGVRDYGVFVELLPNLSGLADPCPDLREGDHVCVYIKSILPQRQKIKLVVLHRLERAPLPPLTYYLTEGHLDRWCYSPTRRTIF